MSVYYTIIVGVVLRVKLHHFGMHIFLLNFQTMRFGFGARDKGFGLHLPVPIFIQ